jgi:hypothetical protein
MSIVLGLLVIGLSICAVMATCVGLGVWWVARSIRRVRRSVGYRRGTLMARTVVAPSAAARRIIQSRIALFDAVTATGQVLTSVPAPPILRHLAADLHRTAQTTDQRLDLLAREPDVGLLALLLPELDMSVRQLCRTAAEIRASAWQFAGVTDHIRAAELAAEVSDQVYGLRAGLAEVQLIRLRAQGRPAAAG